MPVRKVSNRGGNTIGKFPSIKMNRMVAFESLIERDYLYVLDYEPNILSFTEQPLTIEYLHDGKALHYTPDFHLVETGKRNVLVECKPQALTETDENQRKFRAAQAWCAEQDWRFVVITDHQLRAGYRLQNIKLLTYYARADVPSPVQGQIHQVLAAAPDGLTIEGMAQLLTPQHPATTVSWIMHLAFRGKVWLPLETAPLSVHSRVALPGREVIQ